MRTKIITLLAAVLMITSLGLAEKGDISDFNPEEKNTDMVKDSNVKEANILDDIVKQLSVPFSVLNADDSYKPGETADINFEVDIVADGRLDKSDVLVFELNGCNDYTPHSELTKEDCNDNIISKHVDEGSWFSGVTLYNDVSVQVPEEEGSYEVVAYAMQEDPWFVKSEDDARQFIKVKEEDDTTDPGDDDPSSGDLNADIDVSDSNPSPGDNVVFEADGSAGNIERYEWDIEGKTAYGETAYESFDDAGTKTIELTVKDQYGNEDTTSTSIDVERDTERLRTTLNAPNEVKIGESVTLDASGSTGDGSLSYQWKVDGQPAGSGGIISQQFEEQGQHQVSVTVTDSAGQDNTESTTVYANYVEPEAGFTVSSKEINAGQQIQLDASPSSGGSYPIQEYKWEIGDKIETGQRVTTKVPGSGTKQIRLEVIDSEQNSDTASEQITVNQQFELSGIEMQAPRFVVVEEPTTFRFVESSANIEAGLQRVEWSIDGQKQTGPEVQKEFLSTGDKQITMTVIDQEGQEVTVDHTVTVQEQEPGIIEQIVTSITDLLGLN